MPQAVILTALPVEYLAVRSHLDNLQEVMHPQGTIYERGKFIGNGQTWDVGIAEVGAGNSGTAIEAERAITYFNPDCLIYVGIAGGLGIKDVAVGDVIAATQVYSYESGKVGENVLARPALGHSAYTLIQRAKAEARKEDWLNRLPSLPASKPRVFVAPIAAGEKVIASIKADIFKFIRAHYEDAIAIEMEGFGFLSAAFSYPNIRAIVIRGISDLIGVETNVFLESDQKAESALQQKASDHASAFAFELLSKLQTIDETFQKNTILVANSQQQRLKQKQEILESEWEIRRKKLNQLRRAYAIETGVSVRFQLEHQIQDEENILIQLEQELDSF